MNALFDPLLTLSTLWRHRHASREEILAFQAQQLRRLVAHAYERVPYYRQLFDQQGLKPQDIRSQKDLSAIPITSKRELQALPVGEVVAQGVDPRRLITQVTTGSSGEPFAIRRTWWEAKLLQAFRLRALHDLGIRMTDKLALVVLAQPPEPQDQQLPVKLLRALRLYRRGVFHCLLPAREILRQLRQFSPDVLGGYASVLARLAQDVETEGLQAPQLRFVAVGAEVLTPLMRRQIARAFNVPVFDLYASTEFMLLAWECKETGEFHTCDDEVIIEILKDGKPVQEGERGEVVATNLHAFAMPFLRYRLGDVVTKGAAVCRCGKPYATIRAIQGRMIDYFPLPGGRLVHPYAIVFILEHEAVPWLRQYQLLQEREDRVLLYAVPARPPTSAELHQLEESVALVLGPEVEFQVVLVPEIQLERNGKFRVSRSLVRSAYDGIDWDKNP